MTKFAYLALACVLAGCPATTSGTATVTTGPGPARPMPAPQWDSSGWTLLGSTVVNGRTDRDVIQVPRAARWDKLTLVVTDSDLDLLDLDVVFANGERWSPKLKYHFHEGDRTRAIDLPGDDRHIARIELLYKNTPGGGRARVEVYAKDIRNTAYVPPPPPRPVEPPPPPPPPPAGPRWDSTGWTLLGSTVVNGRTDRDVIQVPRAARWDKLTLVVTDSELDLLDLDVVFANGERWSPKLKYHFRENDRTRAIDLPGDDRHIARIELVYRNTPGGGRARVEVYGKDVRGKAPPAPPPVVTAWDAKGWTLLGAQTVNGKKDRDIYPVGRKAGRIDVITIVVKGSDLEMDDFIIQFEDGSKWEPKLKHVFREGTATRQIDLPGSDRIIKNIEVRYKNLPGGGNARVEVYGRDTKQGRDPKK